MLSIIICSISPSRLQAVEQNIKETIGLGVLYEIIALDNREKKWSLAKVYNWGAQKAIYPYLFFVHEDVKFHSVEWGWHMEQKLSEPDCGVIGFAGSKVKLKSYSGWYQIDDWNCFYFYQGRKDGSVLFRVYGVCLGQPFEEVITLDGFAMFVKKEVWAENPFDEEVLTGFHCYDLDFSLQIAKKYKNYVCCSSVLIEHFSGGVFNYKWYADTIRLHDSKWKNTLPLLTNSIDLNDRELAIQEEDAAYRFLFVLLRSDASKVDKKKNLIAYWKRPFSCKHFAHCLACTLKYLRGS